GPQRPQLGEQPLFERGAEVRRTGRTAGAALEADDPFDRQHMLLPPGDHRVVDVEELLGQFVEFEPAIRVAIDLEPGSGERFRRLVADIETRTLKSPERGL